MINEKNLIQRIERLEASQKDTARENHTHNGYNSLLVNFEDITQKKLYIHHTIYGTDAATAANYGVFFIVPIKCVITGFQEVHQTAGTSGGSVVLNLEKLEDGEALGAGNEVLDTDISLKATINEVQDGVLTTTLADRTFAKGDRLALKDTGTLTSVANVTVKIELIVVQ